MQPKEHGHAHGIIILVYSYIRCLCLLKGDSHDSHSICRCNCSADTILCFFLEVKLSMKCGEHTENISGPISVTEISGGLNEDSVVSGPVCQPNTPNIGIDSESLFWQFEKREIPRPMTEDGYLLGWIAVVYADPKKTNLALQRFPNKQAKEGFFTCFYKPGKNKRPITLSVGVYFPSE